MSYVQSIEVLLSPAAAGLQKVRALGDYEAPSLHVSGLAADSLQVVASNKPPNAGTLVLADFESIGTAITADGVYAIDPTAVWVSINRTGTADAGASVLLAGLAKPSA